MANRLTSLKVRNYRSLADVAVELEALNVVFGPNGAGKSSLLDTIWFVRDCAINGVEQASSSRSHGIGMLWDGAEPGDHLSIELGTGDVVYELRFGLSSGRIEPFLGERLTRASDDLVLLDRKVGAEGASFFNWGLKQMVSVELREPASPVWGATSISMAVSPRPWRSIVCFASSTSITVVLRSVWAQAARLGDRARDLGEVARQESLVRAAESERPSQP